jgi:hypothetical protein
MNRLVALQDPTALPWHFVGLELVTLLVAGLTLRHALRAHARGDRAALFTWLTIVVYGVAMEVVSYNLVDNFAHGQFTVMFYDRQLPLYVTAIYPVLLYTGIATARWLGLRPAAEAVAAGALIVAMDASFDLVGPRAGWWRWYDTDPNIAYRWAGVPVTSFYWHLAFGGVLAALTARVARARRPPPWLALPLSAAVIVLGVLCFMPFHGLAALGVSHGVIVGSALTAAAAVAAAAFRLRRGASRPRDTGLLGLWLPFVGFHAAVAIYLAAG